MKGLLFYYLKGQAVAVRQRKMKRKKRRLCFYFWVADGEVII